MPEYFSHDYSARKDPKLIKLLQKMGQNGKGIYWDVIEILYEQGGYIMRSECDCIAFDLHVQSDELKNVIENFDLFKLDDEKIWSESVLRRIEIQIKKSNSASKSASYRWAKYERNANAMRTQCDGNANIVKDSIKNDNIAKDNKESIENNKIYSPISNHLKSRILEKRQATITDATIKNWNNVCRLMVERDNRTEEQIKQLIDECHDMIPNKNGFTWANNILSMTKLREQWNNGKIYIGMNTPIWLKNKKKEYTTEELDRMF